MKNYSKERKAYFMGLIASIMTLVEAENISYGVAARATCIGLQELIDRGSFEDFDNDNSTE